MTREEIEPIIKEYRKLSRKIESCGENEYKRIIRENPGLKKIVTSDNDYDYRNTFRLVDEFVEWISDNIDEFEDIKEEHDLIISFIETRDAWTNSDFMFPNGHDDD